MALSERQKSILKLCIKFYISNKKPIASQLIQKHLPINISSATIRNEMAYLTKLGFLTQSFSSSGRIPETKAYRFLLNQPNNKSRAPFLRAEIIKSNWQITNTSKEMILNQLLSAINKHSKSVSFYINKHPKAEIENIKLLKINDDYTGIYLFDSNQNIAVQDYVKTGYINIEKIQSHWNDWLVNKKEKKQNSDHFKDSIINKHIMSLLSKGNNKIVLLEGLETFANHPSLLSFFLSQKEMFSQYILELTKKKIFECIGDEHNKELFKSTGLIFSKKQNCIIGLIGNIAMDYLSNKQLIHEAMQLYTYSQQISTNVLKPIKNEEYSYA